MYILNPEKSSGIRTHARKNVVKNPSGKTLCDCDLLIFPPAGDETGRLFTTAKKDVEDHQKSVITFAFSFLRGILYLTFFFCINRRDG